MVLKNHAKDVTPGIPYSGQFIEHAGAEVLYVWCMETCSLVVQCYQFYSMFIDGKKLNFPAAKRYNDPNAGGTALGDLSNSNVSKFIGGFQQHLGAPWNAPEVWMLNYTGLI
jgi:hypothetical protein